MQIDTLYGCDIDNIDKYIFQYENAFNLLYKNNSTFNPVMLPMLFTLRQVLELSLKKVILNLSNLSGSNSLLSKLNTTHDIQKLYNGFLEHYNLVKNNDPSFFSEDQEHLGNLKLLMDFFIKFDNKSYALRYPEDTKGINSFDDDIIDISQLKNLYDKSIIVFDVTSEL